jgi:predicted peroxiredoxin
MKKTLIALGLAVSLGVAHAQAPQPVTVILNSGSTMTQGIAMVLANQMQEQGAQVHVLLCDRAADIALRDAGGETLKPNDVTPAQLLGAAIGKGATAAVCALYLPNTGHSAEALREGVTPARPDVMGAAMLEADRKVLVF